jgi:hypothetical protein
MASSMTHRGAEFEVLQIGPRRRQREGGRAITREVTALDRKAAIAQCKLEIDRKLWR